MSDKLLDDTLIRHTAQLSTVPDDANLVRGFQLDVLEGPNKGDHWESETDRCTIGYHSSSNLVLKDKTVSRFHCEITVLDRGAAVRDLASSNGTILDGVRVVHAFLRRGSLLRLGRTVVRFQYMGKRNRISLHDTGEFGQLVGHSVVMRATFALMKKAAATDITILLQGETGTGKSAAARSIHMESARADGPFVMMDCGSIPSNLLESELFGHEKGAFTGADSVRVGAFENASGGTIFLDEIGEMPLELQAKLLSVLENREIRRIGTNTHRPVDVRVIAATNRDLRELVNAGRFREDLYYRIAVVSIEIPPLRQRLEDLPILVENILTRLDTPAEHRSDMMTSEFLHALRGAAWPGNVRELRNYLERSLIFDDAAPMILIAADDDSDSQLRVDASVPLSQARQEIMAEFERIYVSELLRASGGKVSRAAAEAGVDRTYLYRLLRRHKIKKG